MKFARAAALAAFVLLIAVTPLSAFLDGGKFDTWLPGSVNGPPVHVMLADHTGLVRDISSAKIESGRSIRNPDANQRVLVVDVWGRCGDYAVDLSFQTAERGYIIRQQNLDTGCSELMLLGHGAVAVTLWAPVDASTVRLDSPFTH